MKMFKRLVAGMAAAVMAFSTLSIGASAYTWNYTVDFYSSFPQYSHVYYNENKTVNSTLQEIDVQISSKTYSGAYVYAKNSLDTTNLVINAYNINSNYHKQKSFGISVLGTTANIYVGWKNYQTGTYIASADFNV